MDLEDDLGVIELGKLADIVVLNEDPLADISRLQGGRHLSQVIKDGKTVDLNGGASDEESLLAFR